MADTASTNIIIAISRQLGAGGGLLGQRLANSLGWSYLDREILRMAAEQVGGSEENLARWEERVSNFWDRLSDSFSLGPAEGVYTTIPAPNTLRDERLFEIESRVITETAKQRNAVIIGRGGGWILRNHPGVIRVLLHAPVESRIPAVMTALGLKSEAEARAAIQRIDRDRERFVHAMTNCSLTDARNFDLSIQTESVGLDAAEKMVLLVVENLRRKLESR